MINRKQFRNSPIFSPFQMAHIGTTQSGMSGILPFQHTGPPPTLTPNQAHTNGVSSLLRPK